MRRPEYLISALWLSIILILASCSPRVEFFTYSTSEAVADQGDFRSRQKCCRESESYPASETSVKVLRVVFRFMYDSLGQGNLQKEEAIEYARDLIRVCNEKLLKPTAPVLGGNGDLPALGKGYKYQITPATSEPEDDGIYFHRDQDLYAFVAYGKNSNNYDRQVIRKYQTESDSFINIFMMPHHPDSVDSPTYKARRNGIALGYSLKVAGYYSNDHSPEAFAGLVNHEIGHILGLSHTWNSNDGCDDTPKHSNCWIKSDEPPCDTAYSNNMMDYNAFQDALSPCQISRVKRNLTRWRSRQRHLAIPTWCAVRDTLHIRDSVVWDHEQDLSSHVMVHNKATLHIKCRVSIPKDGWIKVMPEGHLILDQCWLHNSCGHQWNGILIGKEDEMKGTVTTTTPFQLTNLKRSGEAKE